MKLSDTMLVILNSAAQRDTRMVLPLPANCHTGRARQCILSMLKNKLVEETPAGLGEETWRTEDEHGIALVITDAGIAALDGLAAEDAADAKIAKDRLDEIEANPELVKVEKKPRAKAKKAKAEPKPKKAAAPRKPKAEAPAKTPRAESKQDKAIAMMRRKNGASGAELALTFGWQAHTVRGFIAAACKKKLGLNVLAEKHATRGTVYRIEEQATMTTIDWQSVSTIAAARDGRRILVSLRKIGRRSLGQVRFVRWRPHDDGGASGVWLSDVAGAYFSDPDFFGWAESPAPLTEAV